ncbi:sodium:solute symporter family protein [Moorena sp. SIO3I6]|uniref:sodium/pantothenate symporter n=1 Tax=Moorena sp. SIO3I6 TaxID=2607831 RepID=UPI0013FA1BB1|nr:sodium:solute symporter family protein [Moorena sp. SIO3I6]NEP22103.1 sodium:solute symporter family protein [Moorena sp. SIO3I6]
MTLDSIIPYVVLAGYLLVTLVVGLVGYRQQQNTPDDYFLADRNMGAILLFFTLIATNFSAFAFLGFSGSGYRIGLSYYGMMGFGTGLIALTFYFIGYRVWLLGNKHGLITPSELMEARFRSTGVSPGISNTLKLIFLAVMVIFTIPYLTLQPIGAGYIIETLTNGQIPYFTGATFLTIVIVLYVFMGGMRSVALTDVIQGVLMFTLMLAAVAAIASSLGGIAEANRTVYTLKPELFSRQGIDNFFTYRKWFSFMILWMLSVPMFPQMFMRFYTSKNSNSLKVSVVIYPLVSAIMFICPVLIGMWGHISFSDLTGKASDQVFPMMLAEHTPIWLASLVMVGALAAMMSTLDSQLLALSSMLTRDIYFAYFRKTASLKEQTFVGRLLIVLLAIIGLIIAKNPPDTITAIATQAFTGLAVLFPTVIAVLYSRTIHPLTCIVSILVGEAAVIGFQLGIIPKSLTFGFLPVVPIVALSGLIIIVGSIKPIRRLVDSRES